MKTCKLVRAEYREGRLTITFRDEDKTSLRSFLMVFDTMPNQEQLEALDGHVTMTEDAMFRITKQQARKIHACMSELDSEIAAVVSFGEHP